MRVSLNLLVPLLLLWLVTAAAAAQDTEAPAAGLDFQDAGNGRPIVLDTASAASTASAAAELARLTVSDETADALPVRYDTIVWQVSGRTENLGRLVQGADSGPGILVFGLYDAGGMRIASEAEISIAVDRLLLRFALPTTASLSRRTAEDVSEEIYSLRAQLQPRPLGAIDNAVYTFSLHEITLGGQSGAELPVPVDAAVVTGSSAQLQVQVTGSQLEWLDTGAPELDFLDPNFPLLDVIAAELVSLAVQVTDRYGNPDLDATASSASLAIEVRMESENLDTRCDALDAVQVLDGIVHFRWARWPSAGPEFADIYAVLDIGGGMSLRTATALDLATEVFAGRLLAENIRVVQLNGRTPGFSVEDLLDGQRSALRFTVRAVAEGPALCAGGGVRPLRNDERYADDAHILLSWNSSEFSLAVAALRSTPINSIVSQQPGSATATLSRSSWVDGVAELGLELTPSLVAGMPAAAPLLQFSVRPIADGTVQEARFSRRVIKVQSNRLLAEDIYIEVQNELIQRISPAENPLAEDIRILTLNEFNRPASSADGLAEGRVNILRFTVRAVLGGADCMAPNAACVEDISYAQPLRITPHWDESQFSLTIDDAPAAAGRALVMRPVWTRGTARLSLRLMPLLTMQAPSDAPLLNLVLASGVLQDTSFSRTITGSTRAALTFEAVDTGNPVMLSTTSAAAVQLAAMTVGDGLADGLAVEYDTFILVAAGEADILRALGSSITLTVHEENLSQGTFAIAYGMLVTSRNSAAVSRRIIFTRSAPVRLGDTASTSAGTVRYQLRAQYAAVPSDIIDNRHFTLTLRSAGLSSRVAPVFIDPSMLPERTVGVRTEVAGTELRWLDTGAPELDFFDSNFPLLDILAAEPVSLAVQVTDRYGNLDLEATASSASLAVEVRTASENLDTECDVLDAVQAQDGVVHFRWARWPSAGEEDADIYAVLDVGGGMSLRTATAVVLIAEVLAERLLAENIRVVQPNGRTSALSASGLPGWQRSTLRFTLRAVAGGQALCAEGGVRPFRDDTLYADDVHILLYWDRSELSLAVSALAGTAVNPIVLQQPRITTVTVSRSSWVDGRLHTELSVLPGLASGISQSTLHFSIRDAAAALERAFFVLAVAEPPPSSAAVSVELRVSPNPAAPGAWVEFAAVPSTPIDAVQLRVEAVRLPGGDIFVPFITAADGSTSPLTLIAGGASSRYLPDRAGSWLFTIRTAEEMAMDAIRPIGARLEVRRPMLDFSVARAQVDADDLVLALRYLRLCAAADCTDAAVLDGLGLLRNLTASSTGSYRLRAMAEQLVIPDVTGSRRQAGQAMGDAADLAVLLYYLGGVREGLFSAQLSQRERTVRTGFIRQALGLSASE